MKNTLSHYMKIIKSHRKGEADAFDMIIEYIGKEEEKIRLREMAKMKFRSVKESE